MTFRIGGLLLFSKGKDRDYAQISQMTMAPERAAMRVNGMPMRMKSLVETLYPSFCRMPIPAMLAEAPIGVMLPPSVAPISRPNANRYSNLTVMRFVQNEKSLRGLLGTITPRSPVSFTFSAQLFFLFVFYPFIQKYFEAGVMIGAIKE